MSSLKELSMLGVWLVGLQHHLSSFRIQEDAKVHSFLWVERHPGSRPQGVLRLEGCFHSHLERSDYER